MSRDAKEGVVVVSGNETKTSIIEVNCETDFVAKDENFKTFCQDVLNYCLDNDLKSIKEIAEDLVSERQSLVQKVGENVIIRKKESIKGDNLYSYIHSNGKVGALVSLQHSNEELGKDIAMHVTASNPKFLSPDEVDSETIDKEKQILKAQVEDTDKPFQIIEKMIEGRLNKYLSEISLLKQPFVKDPSISVEKTVDDLYANDMSFFRKMTNRLTVGVGNNSMIWTTDGTSWNNAASYTNLPYVSVAEGNNFFVAIDSAGNIRKSGDGTNWTAVRTMTDSDIEGFVLFTIDYLDLAGNAGVQNVSTTDQTGVIFDRTIPDMTVISIVSDNNNYDHLATVSYTHLTLPTNREV